MFIYEKDFDAKVVKLCHENNIQKLIDFICLNEFDFGTFSPARAEFVDAIGKLKCSSNEKLKIIDGLMQISESTGLYLLSEIVKISLINECEVLPDLMAKYGDITDWIGPLTLPSFLIRNKRYDLLDALLKANNNLIPEALFTMKYFCMDIQSDLDYISSKYIKPEKSENNYILTKIVLRCAKDEVASIPVENIKSIRINNCSLNDFLNSNETYISSLKLETYNKIEYFSYNTKKVKYTNLTYITDFNFYFADGENKLFDILDLSDDDFKKSYIERKNNTKNGFQYTYNNTYISKDYFSTYVFEELIKFKLKLPYNAKIKDEDLLKIKTIKLSISKDYLFLNINMVIQDLLKIPNLEILYLLVCTFENSDDETFDVSPLVVLPKLKKLTIYDGRGEREFIGLQLLAKPNLLVKILSYNRNRFDESELTKIYAKKGGKIIFEG